MEINREFRKIPSLKFLYEVSEDGRIFRNVKSKKQNKIIVDYHQSTAEYFTFICREGKVKRISIASVVAECWLGEKLKGYEIDHIDKNSLNNHYKNLRYVNCPQIIRPLLLIKDGEQQRFESTTAAARYLAVKFDKKVEQVRDKFKRKRSHVYGYDVIYLNVETVCTRFTEQETVH